MTRSARTITLSTGYVKEPNGQVFEVVRFTRNGGRTWQTLKAPGLPAPQPTQVGIDVVTIGRRIFTVGERLIPGATDRWRWNCGMFWLPR